MIMTVSACGGYRHQNSLAWCSREPDLIKTDKRAKLGHMLDSDNQGRVVPGKTHLLIHTA